MSLQQQLQQPLRYPDTSSPQFMSKRARWLIVLGFLFPGSAQTLAGKKALGRFALVAMIGMVLLLVAAGAGLLLWRAEFLSLVTNQYVLLAAQALIVGYALLWLVLAFNTLFLIKLPKIAAGHRLPLAFLLVVLTALPCVGSVWAFNTVNASRNLISELFVERPPVAPDKNGRYNILLLGTDAGADREGLRPDSVTLISVDAETGKSIMIGLPREMANMQFNPDSPMYEAHPEGFGVTNGCYTERCWLNSLYAEVQYFQPELYPDAVKNGSEPGIEATKDAVSGSTGLKIHFYVLLNMDGFVQLVDALGGVDINVTEQLPIGGDAYGNGVEGYIEPGKQHLDGYHALWYARSRYGSANGDYDRMERQRELQGAILAQMKPSNVLLRFQDIISSGSYLAETDIPQGMVGVLTDLAVRAKKHQPERIELVPPTIITEDPDFDLIRQMIATAIADQQPESEEE